MTVTVAPSPARGQLDVARDRFGQMRMQNPPMIQVRDLELTYRSRQAVHHALRGVSFHVDKGGFYSLLGPSGCGKSTTLRCIAGLERPDRGEIQIGDRIVYSSQSGIWVPPHQRQLGMVFQSYAIWPHMNVFNNVAFPLRQKRGLSRAAIRDRVLHALAVVKLEAFADRPAPFLSGGQQQRLALARSLVGEPAVILLDEPLSNLDAKLREDMRGEIRDLVKRVNITTLFVTHEQIEALTMSDIVAVMNDGKIVQEGPPSEIYRAANDLFVAGFLGKANFLPGRIVARHPAVDGRHVEVETPAGRLRCALAWDASVGDMAVVTVRPEDVSIAGGRAGADANHLSGEVVKVSFLGDSLDCIVKTGEQVLHVKTHRNEKSNRGHDRRPAPAN